MKKIILGIGIAIIILLAGVWGYLLFFNTSASTTDLFSLFNFGDTTDTTISLEDLNNQQNEVPTIDVGSYQALRQLTTKPVVGQQEVLLSASTSPMAYFVEAGTGHVFSINLTSGEESRISNITVPGVISAEISTDGKYAVLKSGEGSQSEITIVTLPTNTTELGSSGFSANVISYSLTSDNELLYATQTTTGVLAKVYNPVSLSTRTVFELPFHEATIDWGTTAESNHYVYPKASTRLQGFLYKITKGTLSREPIAGYGLSAKSNSVGTIYSIQKDSQYQTFLKNEQGISQVYVNLIPEKCVFSKKLEYTAVCAYDPNSETANLPDTWYRGETGSRDELWLIDLSKGEFGLLANTYSLVARDVDVLSPTFNDKVDRILFINRVDNTLWAYDLNPSNLVE